MSRSLLSSCAAVAVCAVVCLPALSQNPQVIEPSAAAKRPNADATYQAVRTALPQGQTVAVKNFTITREGAAFTFNEGQFAFYGSVNGRTTGAVFTGSGTFHFEPSSPSEKHSLALLTKGAAMDQSFTAAVFRFTDKTADEIRQASTGVGGVVSSQQNDAAMRARKDFRESLHENLDVRLLGDVLNTEESRPSFFLASFRAGGFWSGKDVLFIVDPDGTFHAAPDQVELTTWTADLGPQVWVAERLAGADAKPWHSLHVSDEDITVNLESSGKMDNKAVVTMTASREGMRVLPLDLYPTLRVSGVYAADGSALDFVQEDKNQDPQFAVLLPKAPKQGEPVKVLVKYAGPDAVQREGPNIYDLTHSARTSWYPAGSEVGGGFANFRMTFHVPHNLQVVATGDQVSSEAEKGGHKIVWQTKTPIPLAGFNIADFKKEEVKTPKGFIVDAYAADELPDRYQGLESIGAMGTMATTPGLKQQAAIGNAAIQVYSDEFGPLPYDHVSLTQQNTCLDGQGWPTMVYLPICAFWDATIRNQLGLQSFGAAAFWDEVTPHEVAHQWWGDLVGWSSYRDQWMSEGFATFSAGLFLQRTNKTDVPFLAYYAEQKKQLLQKQEYGVRPIDVGPLTMGYRVNNSKTGNVYQSLIYSKGAYVLHMLEMLYWSAKYGDLPFKLAMQRFVKSYAGKAATTEDFKASMENNLPYWLNLDGNGKLDWFFNEYVYGTELPHYEFTSSFTVNAAGETIMHASITQNKVSDAFQMLVPIYLTLQDGRVQRMVVVKMKGNKTETNDIPLGKLPSPAKKAALSMNADVLSD